jgi:hypothetical protein
LKHHCPSFSHHLILYLNRFLDPTQRIPRSQLEFVELPFDKLSVWHTFKFSRDTLGNDIDAKEEQDTVNARPRRGRKGIERFDTVAVAHSNEAESTGLQGK